jgi:hypothetical protein
MMLVSHNRMNTFTSEASKPIRITEGMVDGGDGDKQGEEEKKDSDVDSAS